MKLNPDGTAKMPQTFSGLYYKTTKNNKEIVYSINLEKQRGRPFGSRGSGKRSKAGVYTEEKKIEVCTLMCALQSPAEVSKLTKVPVPTIQKWRTEDWWLTTQAKVYGEQDELISSKFTKVVDAALDGVMERIADGDYHYDFRKGAVVRVPVSAAGLAKIVGTVTDKRQLLRGKPTHRTERKVSVEESLALLASTFAQFTANKPDAALQEIKEVQHEPLLLEQESE